MKEENKTNFEEERREYRELLALLSRVQEHYALSNKMKDAIIIVLIVCMMIEACAFYIGFVWYESQFDTTTTTTTEVYTEGDNANAEYNNVEGNQYNDSSVHNEGLKKNE